MANPRPPIELTTAVPGPAARRLIEEDQKYVSPSYTRAYPLVVARGSGLVVEDVDGNRFLDFTAGIATTSTGHCHPAVVAAIRDQAEKLLHMSGTDFYYAPEIELAARLANLAPGAVREPHNVYFGNSGAEAVEAAFKLARHYTGRHRMLAFFGAFHGRTYGAMSLSASRPVHRKRFGPLVPGVIHVPYGYCYRCPLTLTYPSCHLACVDSIETTIFRHSCDPEEVAAIIVEPIQGEGGYVVPPADYHGRLKALAEKYGILFIADEIQSGMGRTGKLLAISHWDVIPDIVALAKGIASGMPLGVAIAPARIMNWPPGAHASTFGGNPISCRAALATLDLILGGLIDNARQVGEYLLGALRDLTRDHPFVGDVRGKGLMIGIELVRDRQTREPAGKYRDRVVQGCFERGLLVLGAGISTLRFCPALTVSQAEADSALEVLAAVLREAKPPKPKAAGAGLGAGAASP